MTMTQKTLTPDALAGMAAAFQRAQTARGTVDAETSALLRGIDIADGYRAGRALHERLVAGGLRPVGRKIGCTNTATWGKLGIDAPIVAHVYAQTVVNGAGDTVAVPWTTLHAPRIELELAFRLKATPVAGQSLEALIDCVDWVAPAIEVVDGHVDPAIGSPATILCDFGAHASLLLGEPIALAGLPPLTPATFAGITATLRVGETVLPGGAVNVMGNPLVSLATAIEIAAGLSAPIEAGEIVTTGALVGPVALEAGQQWRGRLSFAGRDDLTVGLDA
ncbi:hypothetical protein FOB72_10365 [Cupriavidus pauculus]|uniref:Fumarylacetoacetase-like C-terminal domain-containing protein n=1 Tax=Cupriavidus pauculus TaxID=82633 RepID=A0A5P2H3W1_9BURK|nr:fumarylacetoacetate hydrolase family protein [Cupriavidus pauculus]QET02398.1 hypothetical protein FOB72_10365 [Cupriavidus pauculus]